MSTEKGKIEILSVEALEKNRPTVEALWRLSRATRVEFGWHYLLDLTWIICNLDSIPGKRFLDAGAGSGLMQWYLIEQGAREVISADRDSRVDLPLVMRSRYPVAGLRPGDLGPAWNVLKGNVGRATGAGKLNYALRGLAGMALIALPKAFPGRVLIYTQDLADMPEVADNSLDAVVALSSLEHNTPEDLQRVVGELMRKLRPGGKLLATLAAAREKDWFHQASQGWCYTEASLRRLFDLAPDVPSNYARYDELFAALRDCAELRDNLAKMYFTSGDNGMPWGKWDPQYQPVGVCKIKPV
jgi:ubiquinone/menaquinone biosynthesis C-methylase UbiE